jgi:LysM repeat protein
MRFLRGLSGLFLLLLVLSAERQPSIVYSTSVAPSEDSHSAMPERNYIYYTVKPEDTLDSIEKKFRITSMDAVLRLNPELESGKLPVNRQIKIPLD